MSLHILVVEEEESMRDVVYQMLLPEGHKVELASSGREGVKKSAAGSYDLAIVDVGMADLSGEQVAKTIRDQDSGVAIIAMTGSDMTVCPTWANVLLSKPFTLQELRAAIVAATT